MTSASPGDKHEFTDDPAGVGGPAPEDVGAPGPGYSDTPSKIAGDRDLADEPADAEVDAAIAAIAAIKAGGRRLVGGDRGSTCRETLTEERAEPILSAQLTALERAVGELHVVVASLDHAVDRFGVERVTAPDEPTGGDPRGNTHLDRLNALVSRVKTVDNFLRRLIGEIDAAI